MGGKIRHRNDVLEERIYALDDVINSINRSYRIDSVRPLRTKLVNIRTCLDELETVPLELRIKLQQVVAKIAAHSDQNVQKQLAILGRYFDIYGAFNPTKDFEKRFCALVNQLETQSTHRQKPQVTSNNELQRQFATLLKNNQETVERLVASGDAMKVLNIYKMSSMLLQQVSPNLQTLMARFLPKTGENQEHLSLIDALKDLPPRAAQGGEELHSYQLESIAEHYVSQFPHNHATKVRELIDASGFGALCDEDRKLIEAFYTSARLKGSSMHQLETLNRTVTQLKVRIDAIMTAKYQRDTPPSPSELAFIRQVQSIVANITVGHRLSQYKTFKAALAPLADYFNNGSFVAKNPTSSTSAK